VKGQNFIGGRPQIEMACGSIFKFFNTLLGFPWKLDIISFF
jgi:hypothetical protein